MLELIQEAFLPVNMAFTIILIVVVIYWITVIFGALDISFLDIDFDVDGDVDLDVDIDADGDIAGAHGGGVLQSIFEFMYVGEIPVMILFSVMGFSMWVISILSNYYFNPDRSFIAAIPIQLANFVVSAAIWKVIGMKLAGFFKKLDDVAKPRKMMGEICVLKTSASHELGQAELVSSGESILLNVITHDGERLERGQEVVIVGKNDEKGIYVVKALEMELN